MFSRIRIIPSFVNDRLYILDNGMFVQSFCKFDVGFISISIKFNHIIRLSYSNVTITIHIFQDNLFQFREKCWFTSHRIKAFLFVEDKRAIQTLSTDVPKCTDVCLPR